MKEDWWKYHRKISGKDFLNAVIKIRRKTAGCFCRITLWQYKMAVEYSPTNSLANTIAGIVNKIGRGQYDDAIGASWSSGRLIP